MAGAMRKMAVYLGLVEDDEDQYDDLADAEGMHDDRVEQTAVRRYSADDPQIERPAVVKRGARVVPTRAPVAAATATMRPDYRITTVQPRTYNEARQIGEYFRDGVPVIMNLTEMDDADAKRLVDFAAGLSFGLRGSIERVTNKVFLLSPQNITVTAEDKARIAEGGFFNQS
ncbi:MAG: cell division inhibitor SepF [Pseudonocardiales bacterium]|nr:cell division inhibitor SepF [Pseudonocardiales bacterium]